MPRYIDADELIKKVFPYDSLDKKCYSIGAKAIHDAIAKAPTADVVPRSDVAKEFTCVFGQPHKVSDCPISEEVEKARAEVAREIFTEIENIVAADDIHEDLEYEELLGAYAAINRIKRKVLEFKMKYTEEGK